MKRMWHVDQWNVSKKVTGKIHKLTKIQQNRDKTHIHAHARTRALVSVCWPRSASTISGAADSHQHIVMRRSCINMLLLQKLFSSVSARKCNVAPGTHMWTDADICAVQYSMVQYGSCVFSRAFTQIMTRDTNKWEMPSRWAQKFEAGLRTDYIVTRQNTNPSVGSSVHVVIWNALIKYSSDLLINVLYTFARVQYWLCFYMNAPTQDCPQICSLSSTSSPGGARSANLFISFQCFPSHAWTLSLPGTQSAHQANHWVSFTRLSAPAVSAFPHKKAKLFAATATCCISQEAFPPNSSSKSSVLD